jgi:hypothetical protein
MGTGMNIDGTGAMAGVAVAAADATGYALGWDHARYGVTPPPAHLSAASPVRQGWQDGCAAFEPARRLRHAQADAWLALRRSAWMAGQAFDTMTVTPHYLGQLQVTHCPVTREAVQTLAITRLGERAVYASGHLAALGPRASAARAGLTWRMALAPLQPDRAVAVTATDGTGAVLSPAAARRMGVMLSFVTPLRHEEAAMLPLSVLPPNRLHLLNPIQGLQALLTVNLLQSGWSGRLGGLQALVGSATRAADLQRLVLALVARAIGCGHPGDRLRRCWSLEDAWHDPEVLALWRRFALAMDAVRVQSLLAEAARRGLCGKTMVVHSDAQGVEGWWPAEAGLDAVEQTLACTAATSRAGRAPVGVDNRFRHDHAPLHRDPPAGTAAAGLG